MKDSIKVFSIFGIPMELHISFIIVLLLAFMGMISNPVFVAYIPIIFLD